MRINILMLSAVLIAFILTDGFYDLQFSTIEGSSRQTSEFQGKKIVIVILPTSQQSADVPYLQRLDSLSRANTEIVMIGVPSYQDGFNDNDSESLRTWYRETLGTQFIITAGMNTHKSAGNDQHSIFKWLTNKDQNLHFDEDVTGTGQQFFVSENGTLSGVAVPAVKMSNKLFTMMMQQ